MIRFKVSIPKSNSLIAITNKIAFRTYLSSIFTILTCSLASVEILNCLPPSNAIAQSWLLASGTNYGLGLPKTASTGGGTRLVNPEPEDSKSITIPSNVPPIDQHRSIIRSGHRTRSPILLQKMQLPLLTLLTPEDGARTANPQPTFYWYLYDQDAQTVPSDLDNLSNHPSTANTKDHFVGQLRITTSEDKEPTTIFQTDLKMHSGLSSFKLPIAASLQPSKTYRWQITVQDKLAKEVTASGWIVYTPTDDNLQKSLMRALTVRDRAKIYAEAGYWFDAIEGYTRWLNFKPNDLKSRAARNEILKSGFATNPSFDFESFVNLLNTDAPKQLTK
jgi:hypothetical protein